MYNIYLLVCLSFIRFSIKYVGRRNALNTPAAGHHIMYHIMISKCIRNKSFTRAYEIYNTDMKYNILMIMRIFITIILFS